MLSTILRTLLIVALVLMAILIIYTGLFIHAMGAY